ncbi:MAG: DUF4131 domain-containing protein, partial [Burkholderiales bacterium]
MRLNILCFVAGVWWLQQQPALPDAHWALVAAATLLATRLVRCGTPAQRLVREAIVKSACVACGFGWAATCAQNRLSDALPPEWEGRDIELVGVVASLPQPSERNVRFEFDVERVTTPNAVVPRHIVLSWWGSSARDEQPAALPVLAPG